MTRAKGSKNSPIKTVCMRCERSIIVFNSRNMLCDVCRLEKSRKYHREYEINAYWKKPGKREKKLEYMRKYGRDKHDG